MLYSNRSYGFTVEIGDNPWPVLWRKVRLRVSFDLANFVMKVSGIFLDRGIWAFFYKNSFSMSFYPLHRYIRVCMKGSPLQRMEL